MQATFPSECIDRLRGTQSIAVLTGAGISAESGIPTFRDAQTGLWARYNPHELATPQAFERNSQLVWQWYSYRRQLVAAAAPNAAHIALVELERRVPDFTLITQNVDGLHHRAGNKNVVELHGNISRTKCFEENRVVESWPPTEIEPPPCPYCGGRLRPDVVWFGEPLPPQALEAARAVAERCEIFLIIGTSGVVWPAGELPWLAKHSGAYVIEVNVQPAPPQMLLDAYISGLAGEVLPALLAALEDYREV